MAAAKRALLSVSDKNGVLDFARGLAGLGVELLSTGGTAKLLRDAGLTAKGCAQELIVYCRSFLRSVLRLSPRMPAARDWLPRVYSMSVLSRGCSISPSTIS